MLLRNAANKMLLGQITATYIVLHLIAANLGYVSTLAPTFHTTHKHGSVPGGAFDYHTSKMPPTSRTIYSRKSSIADVDVIGATSLAAAAALLQANGSPLDDFGSGHNKNNNNVNDLIAGNSANLMLQQAAANGQVVNLTRHHDGDMFRTSGVSSCTSDTCVGLSSGTAGILPYSGLQAEAAPLSAEGSQTLTRRHKRAGGRFGSRGTGVATIGNGHENCQCRCLPYLSTYREDLGICVDDIHECTLSPFVSGSSSEKIPFVFLPLRGQIIYPSREISFPDARTPVCAVTGAQYLTNNGWSDLRNPIDTDYPFRMFRDEGRTFLQWLGEPDLRQKMQGRLIVVHLVCRDMTLTLNSTTMKDQLMPPKNVFSPCVAFRVNGSPVKYFYNVSEVLFQAETTATLASTSDGMTTREYVVIGVCSLLLGLIYVSSVFLYIHMKKRKSRDQTHRRNSIDDLANEINYPKNDQVTFGAPFNRSGSIYSATSLGTSNLNEPRSRTSIVSLKDDIGIIKKNPLLQHYPQLSDHHSGFASDISNSNSECEIDGSFHDKIKHMQTAALVHPQMSGVNGSTQNMQPNNSNGHNNHNNNGNDDLSDTSTSATLENECIPMENVSIVEDMLTEEKLENLRSMVNGNVRKKLYFNPAYFEPHLLMQPPPAAIEFLQKIREVIAIAKYKMATKRFQPSLTHIPEETTVRSDTSSMYGCTAPIQSIECQGCAYNRCSGHVKNCGDKRNSIEKWLETVTEGEKPLEKDQIRNNKNSESNPKVDEVSENQSKTSLSHQNVSKKVCQNKRNSPRKEITPPKQRPPPPPAPTASRNQISKTSNGQHGTNSTDHVKNSVRPNLLGTIAQQGEQRTHNNQVQKVSIPVNRCNDNFAGISNAVSAYGFAGSEIYNNPKFNLHDSPNASQRSRDSSHRSKSPKKRLDTLEQYATASTPTSLNSMDRHHYNMLRNLQKQQLLMETHYDFNGSLRSNASFHLNIPTPDYDSTIEKKIRDIYNNTQSSGPSVPTPDYSTLSRKSLRQYQPPDSPIYRRKSPQYLIVDYETDSLERLEATKRKSSQSSSSPSSDVSSQLSPSLSTALPLEEELEISHTVYDKNDRFRQDGEAKKKLIKTNSSTSAPQQKETGTRIKYDTPFRGSMTIEVEHEPQSDLERSTDSDQFEPDTLDRKPKKQSFCDVNAWSGYLKNSPPINNYTRDLSSPQFESLPPTYTNINRESFILRNRSNSFNNQEEKAPQRPAKPFLPRNEPHSLGDEPIVPNFGSLRDIYETQAQLSRQNSQSSSCRCGSQINANSSYDNLANEQGRLLTLEAKHTRRQQKVEALVPPPPHLIEIANVMPNKTTIKISSPKENRSANRKIEVAVNATESPVHNNSQTKYAVISAKSTTKHDVNNSKNLYDDAKNYESSTTNGARHTQVSKSKYPVRSPPPPPPPPASFSSTTLASQKSQASNGRNNNTEDDSVSNISESTEITRVSDTVANSEFNGSCQNTLETKCANNVRPIKDISTDNEHKFPEIVKTLEPPIAPKTIHNDKDFEAIFNTNISGLRTDYSLTKYLNRRKTSISTDECNEDDKARDYDIDSHIEANNNNHNNLKNLDSDSNKVDVISISSRSNRSSSRLSDRTKEMYRNAGVPVGIAYPQRSSVGSASSQPPTNTVQTVYRCEIEPVQLTHGMQVAMGLKDRAKKTKDLKNAWKKFVSMAASKFSPTHSPAPPFDKKATQIIEAIDRDEGISSLIDELPQVSTPKSSFSAPTQQNYYEQRFGTRLTELDSGYMSADSSEVYRRSFYDRYNFKMRSGRDHIISVDTIEDNSEGGSVVYNGTGISSRRNSLIENQRFEDLEHMGQPPPHEMHFNDGTLSDADSDKTITDGRKRRTNRNGSANIYSSEDDLEHSPSYGSSETDGETNGEEMWESGAESIETHSVLYKNIRNH